MFAPTAAVRQLAFICTDKTLGRFFTFWGCLVLIHLQGAWVTYISLSNKGERGCDFFFWLTEWNHIHHTWLLCHVRPASPLWAPLSPTASFILPLRPTGACYSALSSRFLQSFGWNCEIGWKYIYRNVDASCSCFIITRPISVNLTSLGPVR